MNSVSEFVKRERRRAGLTQEDFAIRCGVGLRFLRDLEQGKESCRMDKVNQVLSMFDHELVPGMIEKDR